MTALKFFLKALCIAAPVLLAGVPAQAQTDWQVASAAVTFKIKNAGMGTQGRFSGFKGKIVFDANALEISHLEASVDVKTIDTGNWPARQPLAQGRLF